MYRAPQKIVDVIVVHIISGRPVFCDNNVGISRAGSAWLKIKVEIDLGSKRFWFEKIGSEKMLSIKFVTEKNSF